MESISSKEQERNSAIKKKIGFVVNPIGEMGGRVGLKGTDGSEVLNRARKLGAGPVAQRRAIETLTLISEVKGQIDLLTCSGEMGEDEAKRCGITPTVIESIVSGKTTSENTKAAARKMPMFGTVLLIFAGGDGTARDVYEATEGEIPVLGIPAGVKIRARSRRFAARALSLAEEVNNSVLE
jgi:predicted polyphosphate/ATP-dependent NAD kinase